MTNATFNTLFAGSVYLIDGKPFQSYHCAADDRLRCVANCTDVATLRAALGAEGLQKSVRDAIERKIRRLERAQ